MTPKGTTDDRGDQWQIFEQGKWSYILESRLLSGIASSRDKLEAIKMGEGN